MTLIFEKLQEISDLAYSREKLGLRQGKKPLRFLQDVSLYLGDMRLVSNIVNEYSVYHGRLGGSGLTIKPDQQLARVIYKNLYPGDFDLLQKGRGYVYALFGQKKQLMGEAKVRLEAGLQALRSFEIPGAERLYRRELCRLYQLFLFQQPHRSGSKFSPVRYRPRPPLEYDYHLNRPDAVLERWKRQIFSAGKCGISTCCLIF